MRYVCHGCEVSCRLEIDGIMHNAYCPGDYNDDRWMWNIDESKDKSTEPLELRIAELIKERDTYHERLQDAHRKTEEWRNKYNDLNADFESLIAAAELEGFDRAQRIIKENNAED